MQQTISGRWIARIVMATTTGIVVTYSGAIVPRQIGDRSTVDHLSFAARQMPSGEGTEDRTNDPRLDPATQNPIVDGWIAYAGKKLKLASGGEVYVTIAEREVDLWTVIARRDLALVRRIVGVYDELLAKFEGGPGYKVDFHVLYAQGKPIEQVIPSRAIPVVL